MSKRKQKFLCGILICANLALIWGNSLLPAESSSQLSGWLQAFLSFLPEGELVHTLLRKAAHFSEFALLGLLMGWMSALMGGRPQISVLGLGLGTGCVDETIQLFVPGRASSLLDVWIDFSGFTAGLLILIFGYTFIQNKKHPMEDTKL